MYESWTAALKILTRPPEGRAKGDKWGLSRGGWTTGKLPRWSAVGGPVAAVGKMLDLDFIGRGW